MNGYIQTGPSDGSNKSENREGKKVKRRDGNSHIRNSSNTLGGSI